MTLRIVWDGRQSPEAEFFVEPRRLKTMRRQDDLTTPSTNGLLFCGVHQGGSYAGAAHRLVDPEPPNLTAATPRMATQASHEPPGFIFD